MTTVLINPGTGPVPRAQSRWARFNIAAFAREVGRDVDVDHVPRADGDGRWTFKLTYGKRRVEVSMPGCPRACLTNPDAVGLIFPYRIYVDGNSWMWRFAVEIAQEALGLANH